MGLTGIQILKKLPKKNCGECGVPTCMAFAMKVAAGQADIGACPYVDPAVKEEIAEASAPPVRVVKLGGGDHTYKLGGETVLFRHEKRFESPTLIGTYISGDMQEDEVKRRLELYKKYQWERVGIKLQPDVILIEGNGNLKDLVKKVREEIPWVAIVLKSNSLDALKEGIEACGDFRPAIFSENFSEDLIKLAAEAKVPLVIKGDSIGDVAQKSEEAIKKGLKEIILDPGSRGIRELFEDQVIIRKAAIRKRFKPLGFPTIVFANRYTDSLMMEGVIAGLLIPKYAGIIILSDLRADILLNLLIEKMNIFTDPQKPLTVEQGIYPVNGPDEYSPVIITCNFALTYFIVNGEVEGSRVPTWLLIKDTDGLSVLTAWAAGKFNADNIAEFVKKSGIAEKVKHRKLSIPGYVGGMKGELEEELPDWEIIVGPREASGLPAFLKKLAKELREEAGVPAGTVSGGEEVKEEAPSESASGAEAPSEAGHRVVCIAESINIMSKRIGPAMKERNPEPIQKMAKEETELGADYLDLNIGPAKKDGPDLASWIVRVVEEVVDTPISLDTTNPDAMTAGLRASKNPQRALMNSISIQKSRLEKLGPLAAELGCEVVALLWGESGLPRDANERAALVVDLVGKLNEYGIPNEKIWVDPILTPITLGADQIQETLTFLSMLQEITPGVKTTIGLSNVSNGVATHLRPYLNRVMLMMLMKYGLYSAIVDVYDKELVEIAKGKHPDWVEMVHKMMDGEYPDVKDLSPKELEIYKTVKVLTGETIFSESWLEV